MQQAKDGPNTAPAGICAAGFFVECRMAEVTPSAAIGPLGFVRGEQYAFPAAVTAPKALRLYLPFREVPAANDGSAVWIGD